MAIFDMGNMSLDEFCKRLSDHPEQDKEVSAELIKKIFPECNDITTKEESVVILKVYQIEDGELHWYAAHSKDEAWDMHKNEFQISQDERSQTTIKYYSFVDTLTVRADDGSERTQKAHEWIKELGAGLICSSAY